MNSLLFGKHTKYEGSKMQAQFNCTTLSRLKSKRPEGWNTPMILSAVPSESVPSEHTPTKSTSFEGDE